MIAVGRALCRWREQHPDLAALGLHARMATDPDAGARGSAWSILSIRLAQTETRAVVPFTLTEELSAAKTEDLPALEKAVLTALNGKAYLVDPDAAIHRLSLRSYSSDMGTGLAGVATLEWEGVASWR